MLSASNIRHDKLQGIPYVVQLRYFLTMLPSINLHIKK